MQKILRLFSFIGILSAMLLLFGCTADSSAVESPAAPVTATAVMAESSSAPAETPKPAPEPIVFRSGGSYSGSETELALVIDADELPLLDCFPSLKAVDLSGSSCFPEIFSYREAHPDVAVKYTVPLGDQAVPNDAREASVSYLADPDLLLYLPDLTSLTVTDPMKPLDASRLFAAGSNLELHYTVSVAGLTIGPEAETLDLTSASPDSLEDVLNALPVLPNVHKILLSPENGESEWTLDQADALQSAREGLLVDYEVRIFGTEFSLSDEVVSFNGIQLKKQQDELRALLPYLKNVNRLDMESCGISNADMAKLREEFPQPKIVWRVNIGTYSCRTDAIMIRFSSKLPSKTLYDADVQPLKYCTEMRYLDLGHNSIKRMDFLSYMPDLEVVIIAVGFMEDISGIANHEKLEYCEFLSGRIKDLSPLASCPNLEHLNVAYNLITDITPLYGLTKLKRLWISRNSIPKSQIEEIRRLLPDTEINTTSQNPTGEGWRWASERDLLKCERYELLCKQFCYDTKTITYTEETKPVW